MMRFVHPILGIRSIASLGEAASLTASLTDWTMSDESDAAFADLWLKLSARVSSAGGVTAELDLCGGPASLVRACTGWSRYPRTFRGPWSDSFARAVGESTPCWLQVTDAKGEILVVLDGGFDRMIVLSPAVDLRDLLGSG